MHKRRPVLVAVSTAALIVASGAASVVLTSAAAYAATGFGVAPYVDMSNSSEPMLDSAITQAGLKSYTAAFIIGSGCTPIWGDSQDINTSGTNAEIARAQSEGAQTIISFGGAAGAELAQSCTDVNSLTSAYQSVINKYGVNHLDFDVEGAAIADPASINRRYQAIRTLEANNSGLVVSVTIPVLPSGPDNNGQAFLQSAASNGARIDLVNAMTMDYGSSGTEMGNAAISAAQGTLNAARAVWPGDGWGNIGITPMIGQNDSAGEIFTLADAQSVVNFASSNGVGRLAFWSVDRDQPCPGGPGGGASSSCSSVSQNSLDFTRTFDSFTGGNPPPPPPPPPPSSGPTGPVTGIAGKCVDVRAANTTNGTPVQLYDCNATFAQQWTVTSNGTLSALGKCLDVTSGGTANGTLVQLWDCNGTGAQGWRVQTNGELVNPQSGRCLDDPASNTANSTQLQIWDCFDSTNQQWHPPAGPITGIAGKCVDIRAANTTNGTPVQLYDCNGTNAQRWTVPGNSNLNVLGKCMDVASGGTTNGTLVQLWDCNGTGAQVWQSQSNGTLLNPQSGRCLDDPASNTANSTQLQIWDCNGGTNQQWHLS
jgi:chitinase